MLISVLALMFSAEGCWTTQGSCWMIKISGYADPAMGTAVPYQCAVRLCKSCSTRHRNSSGEGWKIVSVFQI